MKRLLLLQILLGACSALSSASAADNAGYLFVTFKGEQSPMTEQIHFGISQDGRNWSALNGGEPTLVSRIGERGVRDPYLLRGHDGHTFYIIATDLSIHLNHDWNRATHRGSKSIVIWESADLVRWSAPRLVKVAPDDAGCTWAPEAVYDEDARDYLVFWASTTRSDNFEKQRIWGSHTKDFRSFSKPFIYVEKPTTVIDATIVRDNGRYYRFIKDEKLKAITMESSEKLAGPWADVPGFSLERLTGYEGPECYPVERGADGKPSSWCLILDHYSKGDGYQPFTTNSLADGNFSAGQGFSFPFHFRHGSILPLTKDEFDRVSKAYTKPARR